MSSVQLDKQNMRVVHDNKITVTLNGQSATKNIQLQPLSCVIQEHLIEQSKKLFQDEIFKQSVVKCSLDKDFAYLFEESGLKIKKQRPQMAIGNIKKQPKIYNIYQKNILRWMQSQNNKTLINIPFKDYISCIEVLHSKLEGQLLIVVTDFHEYYSQKLEQINNKKKDSIKWASLSSSLSLQIKSKILELYQLQKLDLLLISPQLFENQKYQMFKCNTLLINNIQLYEGQSELLDRIIAQTQPLRIVGGYQYLTKSYKKKLGWMNYQRQYEFDNTIWLKGTHKTKNLLNYLSKRNYSKIIVITRDKKSTEELSSSLSLEEYKSSNFLDFISKQTFKSFSMPNLLVSKKDNYQSNLHESFKRCLSSSIIVSPFFEGLRLFQFDLVVFYDLPSIKQYMQLQSLAPNKLGLISDQDYYICRNTQTSSIIDRNIFQKLIFNILQKKPIKSNQRKKRFYSDKLQQFQASQIQNLNINIKSITINKYCSQFQISQTQLYKILNLLKELNMIIMMQPIKYQCLIQERSAEEFKALFPNHNLISRRINILNLASEMKTTTQIVLQTFKNNGIRYLVCQQLMPLKILINNIEQSIEKVWIHQQQQVLRDIREIDLSYTLFQQFTFPNLQFIKKQKIITKKRQMIQLFDKYLSGELQLTKLPLLKLNSVNKKYISEWVGDLTDQKLTIHDIILFIQGNLNYRTNIYQDDTIFKSFYKYKYEDLAQYIESISKNKRQKTY